MISEHKKYQHQRTPLSVCKGLPIIILIKQDFFIFPPKITPLQIQSIIMLYLGLQPLPSCVDNSKRYFNLTYSATRGDEYLTERQESYFIALLRGRKTKNLLYTHPAVATEANTEYTIAQKTLQQHF